MDDEPRSLSDLARRVGIPMNARARALVEKGGMKALEAERTRAREGMRRLREKRQSDPWGRMVVARKAFFDLEPGDRAAFLKWCGAQPLYPRRPKAMSPILFKRKFHELHDRYGQIVPPTEGQTPTEGQQAMIELFESSGLSFEKIRKIMGWSTEKEKPDAASAPVEPQAAAPKVEPKPVVLPDPSVPIAMPDLSGGACKFDSH